MVHFMVTLLHGGYTCFMIDIYVVYSSGYSFLNIVWAKLLSMGYILLNWVKSGFVKCFLNGELDERVDVRF